MESTAEGDPAGNPKDGLCMRPIMPCTWARGGGGGGDLRQLKKEAFGRPRNRIVITQVAIKVTQQADCANN